MTLQQTPYLQKQRNFPQDSVQNLSGQMDLAYIDIAAKINDRIVGQFASGFDMITGEKWFLNGEPTPQQTLRQVYPITGAGSYPHGINVSQISAFTRIWGTATDGTSWYPLPYVDSTAANNQIDIVVTATDIVVTAGGGAPPAITSGYIILEWLAVF